MGKSEKDVHWIAVIFKNVSRRATRRRCSISASTTAVQNSKKQLQELWNINAGVKNIRSSLYCNSIKRSLLSFTYILLDCKKNEKNPICNSIAFDFGGRHRISPSSSHWYNWQYWKCSDQATIETKYPNSVLVTSRHFQCSCEGFTFYIERKSGIPCLLGQCGNGTG